MAAPEPGALILDCCTGTADLALAYDRAAAGRARIVAADFCREMLVLGKEKVQKARAGRGSRSSRVTRSGCPCPVTPSAW